MIKLHILICMFILTGCVSITHREITPVSQENIVKFKPKEIFPIKVYLYSDVGKEHWPFIHPAVEKVVRKRLLNMGYFSSVEFISPRQGEFIPYGDIEPGLTNLDKFFQKTDLNKSSITVYFRELESERNFAQLGRMLLNIITLGLVPLSEDAKFMTGVQIYDSKSKKNYNIISKESIKTKTTTLPLKGYSFGVDHLYEPVADMVESAVVEFSKNGWLNE